MSFVVFLFFCSTLFFAFLAQVYSLFLLFGLGASLQSLMPVSEHLLQGAESSCAEAVSSGRIESESFSNVFDYLLYMGKRYEKRRALRKKKKELEMCRTLTLKPEITALAQELSSKRREKGGAASTSTRLYALARQKHKKDPNELLSPLAAPSEPAFSPRIMEGTQNTRADKVPAVMLKGEQREVQRRAAAPQKAEEHQKNTLTDGPKTSFFGSHFNRAERPSELPIGDRLFQQGEKRMERQYQLVEDYRAAYVEENKTPFNSTRLTRRHYSVPNTRNNTCRLSRSCEGQRSRSEAPFRPIISRRSMELAEKLFLNNSVSTDVFQRLHSHPTMKEPSERCRRALAGDVHPFAPSLCDESRRIVCKARSGSRSLSPSTRLHASSLKCVGHERKDEALTFHPVVSANSKKLWKDRCRGNGDGVELRAAEVRQKLWQEAETCKAFQRQEARAKEAEACTFQPKILPHSTTLVATDSMEERTRRWMLRRDKQIEEERMRLAAEEASLCIFSPRLTAYQPQSRTRTLPCTISEARSLQRFLLRHEAARCDSEAKGAKENAHESKQNDKRYKRLSSTNYDRQDSSPHTSENVWVVPERKTRISHTPLRSFSSFGEMKSAELSPAPANQLNYPAKCRESSTGDNLAKGSWIRSIIPTDENCEPVELTNWRNSLYRG